MSEEIETPDELTLLKERAKLMGVSVSGNIGIDTLKKRIEAKMSGEPEPKPKKAKEEVKEVVKTQAQLEQETRERMVKEKMALLRCRIYNLNPQKTDLRGELITVGNRFLGNVTKFIPFGEQTDNGYHIPRVIYDDLKSRQFQQVKTRTVKGQIVVNTRMVPEYSIEIMPPLSAQELQDLALQQSAAERLQGSNE